MSQIIDEYLYEGKYSVDTLVAFCGITADIISQYVPLKKFVEIAEEPLLISISASASGMNSVHLS